jgi:hypothetical protein
MRGQAAILFTLLAGCGAETAECPPGFTLGDGNLCLQEPDDTPGDPDVVATMEALIEALPECTAPATGNGSIDLTERCIRGACAGDTLAAFEAALGAPTCETIRYSFGDTDYEFASCDFAHGISGFFDAFDGEPVRSSTTYSVGIDLPNADATSGGFGLGAEWSCAVAALGMPSSSTWSRSGDTWRPSSMGWELFRASDSVDNELGLWVMDGRIDSLSMYAR